MHYCGRECQRGDWPLHQAECRGVAAIQPNAPPPSVRLVVRALHQRKKRGRREVREARDGGRREMREEGGEGWNEVTDGGK